MKQAVRVSAHVTVGELETTHRSLDRQIKKLNHRGSHMTPQERSVAAELKKLRLATKDRIALVKT
jgi:uncharacterized protein YdcH (DUF465 family)